jgi:hypothetical protein
MRRDEATQLLVSREDANAAAMPSEFIDERGREAVVSPSERK